MSGPHLRAAAVSETETAAALLDLVVEQLLSPARLPATAAMAATARVVRDTRWRSYRAGRAKIATQAAVYMNWLAPPADYTMTAVEVAGRRLFVFDGPAGCFADLLIPDLGGISSADCAVVGETFAALAETVAAFGGVRLLTVSEPTASMAAVSPTRLVALTSSPFRFEAES